MVGDASNAHMVELMRSIILDPIRTTAESAEVLECARAPAFGDRQDAMERVQIAIMQLHAARRDNRIPTDLVDSIAVARNRVIALDHPSMFLSPAEDVQIHRDIEYLKSLATEKEGTLSAGLSDDAAILERVRDRDREEKTRL